ncbi:MAG TPA: LysM domain-containing protein, partial [Gammaproteobacteria bacterium]|nr:LysM domain-containing protein [Gammaproteobacteria bacterium]
MNAKNIANYDTILYRVRAGDSLSSIIQRYHGSVSAAQRKALISQIQADNSAVTNPNRIVIGQMLQISIPPRSMSISSPSGAPPTLNINKQIIKPL